jgi:hypothetical protein
LYGICGHMKPIRGGQLGCCLTPVYNGPFDEGLNVLQPLLTYRQVYHLPPQVGEYVAKFSFCFVNV